MFLNGFLLFPDPFERSLQTSCRRVRESTACSSIFKKSRNPRSIRIHFRGWSHHAHAEAQETACRVHSRGSHEAAGSSRCAPTDGCTSVPNRWHGCLTVWGRDASRRCLTLLGAKFQRIWESLELAASIRRRILGADSEVCFNKAQWKGNGSTCR